MNKKDFLIALANGLKDLPPDKVSDILFDYQDYFNSQKGLMSEEEIILSLGKVDDLIEKYKEEYSDYPIERKKFENTSKFEDFKFSNTETTDSNLDEHQKETYIKEETNKSKEYSINEENSNDYNINTNATDSFNNSSKDNINLSKESVRKYKIKNPFKRFKTSTFLGILFSLPLAIISIPIGIGLAIATSSVYISFVLLLLAIGALLFFISLVPLLASFGGFMISIVKTLSPLFFIDIPKFILEFPNFFIILLSFSALCLFVCIFTLGLSYFRFAKNKIAYISKCILKVIFIDKGDVYETK